MKEAINVRWAGDMAFEAAVSGHTVLMDAREEVGGHDQGPRPKALMKASLAGCTGMDVVVILRKMREPLRHFRVFVEAELSDGQPAVYERMRVVYEFSRGDGLTESKVERAVSLSQEKYCGVSAMLRKAAELTHEIRFVD